MEINLRKVSNAYLSAGLFGCLFLYMILPSVLWAQDNRQKKVFILHSYHRSLSWDDSIDRTIESIFRKSDQNIEIQIEYMDTKRILNITYLEQLREIYKHKFRNQRFDVIICVDNNALNFLIKHRDEIFSKTPVVFCGVNNFHDSMLENTSLYTGVVEAIEVKGTIDIALRLHPKIRQIVIYGTDTPTYFANKEIVKKVMSSNNGSVDVRFIEGLNIKEVQDNVQKLSDDSIVLLIASLKDEKGQRIFFRQFAEMVNRVSRVPQYSLWDFILGHGIFGGKLISGVSQGEIAAKMALRILNGEKIENILILRQSPNRYMFDYKHMKRFGINLSDLPPKSVLINKPSSFYSQHKGLVWTAIIILLSLLSFITALGISIAKSRRAEVALRESEEKYRSMMEAMKDPAYICSPDFYIEYMNPAMINRTGSNLAGELCFKSIHHLEEKCPWCLHDRVQQGEHCEQEVFSPKNNRTYHISNSPIVHVNGSISKMAVFRDITELKMAEESALQSEQRFRDLFESITDLIYTQDLDGRFVSVNPAMHKLFGYGMDEFIDHRATDFMEPEFRSGFRTQYLEMVKKQGHHEGITCYFKKNKEKVYIEYKSSLVKPDNGETYISGIGRDVTEKVLSEKKVKKLQEQVAQSQKMESIGTLAGGIAHDFNNILFPIVGHTEMLLEDIPEDSPFCDSLNEIYTSSLRARDLVKQILTFSCQESGELKLMKVQPIIKEVLKLIRSTIPTTIEIKQDIQDECGVIKADPTQIHQIVMNLATNAYHAMEETGGELKASLKETKLSEYDMIAPNMEPGVYACLTIADTGVGMDRDLTKKIFDPFFTTKKKGKGTGMGLSVVHGIVLNMNGAIQVYSEPGEGTKVLIYFPVEKSLSENKATDLKTKIQGGTERVLLVDDEEAILLMEKQMLERMGYQVTSSTNSLEALEVFSNSPGKFDIVITDMAMPNMPGDELSAELIKIHPHIPVLLCTGFSETMSEEKAASLGIKGFLLKPVVMKDFDQKIREVLMDE
ncbi:MAG: PAS domain S-box protein [Desulfobacula sp.]|nr:PAS domain S-box protein [Desulfobacula sp.]